MNSNRKIGILLVFIMLVSVFILVTFASADSASANAVVNEQLQTSLGLVNCEVNYTSALIDSTYSVNSDLSGYNDKLNADLNQLQSFASQSDAADFRNFMINDYRVDLRNFSSSFVSWRSNLMQEARGNVASRIINRTNLRFGNRSGFNYTMNNPSNFNYTGQVNLTAFSANVRDMRSQYQSCDYTQLQQEGKDRLGYFNLVISDFQSAANSLANKGYDTTTLNATIQTAQNEVVIPFQTALSSANDSAAITAALREYCLFDGCVNGVNAHLDAAYSIARLNLALQKLSNINETSNMTVQLTQAQSDITNASTALTAVGTAKYTPSQISQVWGNISAAKKSLLSIINSLNSDLRQSI